MLLMFKALADSTRLRILKMLAIKPLCVCEVMAVLKMAQSTSSKHLQVLSNAGFLEPVPGGVWTIYRIAKKPKNPMVAQILDSIRNSRCTNRTREDASAVKKVDRERICLQKIRRS